MSALSRLGIFIAVSLPLIAARGDDAPKRAEEASTAKSAPNPFGFSADELAEFRRTQAANEKLAAVDRRQMMAELGVVEPTLPPMTEDPNRPAGTTPVPGNAYNWSDGSPGHTITRSSFGSWNNYDLAKADVGHLPDVLQAKHGRRVADAVTWWQQRRPEIVADFTREIYGRVPDHLPSVTWKVVETDDHALDGRAHMQHVVGVIDNSAYPKATPAIDFTLYTPAVAKGPVPAIVTLQFAYKGRPLFANPATRDLVLAHGWAYASYTPVALQADTGAELNQGIIGLVNKGRPRKPDDWGAIAAWSWGLSRMIDYFEQDPAIDAKRLGVEGHSRYGKTVLYAAAFEPRWAIVYSSCSGEGGAKLHRHNVGESVDNACGPGAYHWYAGNFLKYGGHWDALPVDQHELIALVAPRPVFITGGTEDLWSDPVGEFKACVAAGPVYRLLGKADLGPTALPAPDEALIGGDIGFREHRGGHTDVPDWPVFLQFADKYFK